MDLDLGSVPSQSGTAILNANSGGILKVTGQLDNETGRSACENLYKIYMDSIKCVGDAPIRRISVSYSSFSFVITTTDQYMYIVRVQSAM
mmetsp:Transcript_10461/g.10529  ORF Transcript_10461/g.10529 Transcript_10461/m.10529 type:complete len:90 (-) Transcript_10461:30-299(-)|eukprot:CAMPEP_0182420352 /NCGR_PEP_ID=MMETSP1167-20130531/5095_1 /TAXON_ID=2988 /ORGANISM="Mallomonas Sp, Strain CCMP3275" /LENGTH=89 /DNA_ID=CAMNT_0024596205 /DNA_START=178 /DNA_END=447 /DNA_ORIENTATION=+